MANPYPVRMVKEYALGGVETYLTMKPDAKIIGVKCNYANVEVSGDFVSAPMNTKINTEHGLILLVEESVEAKATVGRNFFIYKAKEAIPGDMVHVASYNDFHVYEKLAEDGG